MLLALVRLVFTCYIGISLVLAPVRNNLWDWQSLQPTSGSGAQFSTFVMPWKSKMEFRVRQGLGLGPCFNGLGFVLQEYVHIGT